MQTWNELQRDLLARGSYRTVFFASFTCRDHGNFRVGMAGLDSHFPCPECKSLCKARYLAPGITRRLLPLVEQSARFAMPLQMHVTRPLAKFAQTCPPKPSKFERMVNKLGLDPRDHESLIHSAPLRRWVKANRYHHHVPDQLLDAWHLSVFEKHVSTKLPEQTA